MGLEPLSREKRALLSLVRVHQGFSSQTDWAADGEGNDFSVFPVGLNIDPASWFLEGGGQGPFLTMGQGGSHSSRSAAAAFFVVQGTGGGYIDNGDHFQGADFHQHQPIGFRFRSPGNFPLKRIEQLVLVHFVHIQGKIHIMGDPGQDHFLAFHAFPFIRKTNLPNGQRGRQLNRGIVEIFPDLFGRNREGSGTAAAGDLIFSFFLPPFTSVPR